MTTIRLVVTALLGIPLMASVASAQVTASADAELSVQARAQAAIQLPSAAIELRSAGVPAPEVRTAILGVHAHHLPAPEARIVFTRSVEYVHLHGPHPHFGAFITFKLGDGYRGDRLYRAIRVEHEHPRWRPPGLAKGHSVDTPGHRRHGHGRVDVRARGPHGMGSIRVRGPSPMASIRVRGPSPMGSIRVRGGHGGMGSIRVRGGHGGMGSIRVRGGGHGGGMGRGMH